MPTTTRQYHRDASIVRFSDHLHGRVALDDQSQTLPHHLMVFGENDPRPAHITFCLDVVGDGLQPSCHGPDVILERSSEQEGALPHSDDAESLVSGVRVGGSEAHAVVLDDQRHARESFSGEIVRETSTCRPFRVIRRVLK